MKLRILLWIMSLMYRRAAKNNQAMKDYLLGTEQTIQFSNSTTKSARFLEFKDQQVFSQAKVLDNSDLTICFESAAHGFDILWSMATGKDKNAFMRAIQEKQVSIEGDFTVLIWFQKSLKYIR